MDLNKISVKQQGGQMIPQQPGMQQQPQVDPAIQQISMFFKQSIEQGMKPEEVVMGLIQKEVDQNTIVQALMSVGYQENDLQVLFQNIQEQQQPADPTAQQINQDPQQLARQQEIQEGQEGLNVNIDPIQMAKSGIEIKPENEGKFTAWAKARGMGVQQAARKVMANKDRYPTRIVKMANFAKNAAGWNKQDGGTVEIQKLSEDGKNIITEKNDITILKDNPYDNQDVESQVNLNNIQIKIAALQQQAEIAKAQEEAAVLDTYGQPIDMTSQLNLTLEDFKGSDFYTGLETPEQIQMLMDNLVTPINNGTYNREGNGVGKFDAYRRKGLERLNQQKKGGEFKPHFMYKGKRKLRAKDMDTHLRLKKAGYTHDAPKAETGVEMLKKANQFANKNNITISDQDDNLLAGKEEEKKAIDNGSVASPLYISPNMFHSGKRWSAGDAVNLVGELFTGIKNTPDTFAADAAANQADKYANATYDINVDTSEKNINAVNDYLKQYQIENPNSTNLPDLSDKIEINENDINSTINKGVDWLKENLSKMQFQTGGENDEPLTFREWVMQDPVRRSTASAQQEYQSYVDNFLIPPAADANSLYDEINPATLDIDTGGILGGISRLPNTAAAKAAGSASDWLVRATGNANDYLEDVEDDRRSEELFRNLSLADNTQPTLTDPLFKRGKGPDVNSGLYPEIDQVTGYTTLSKYGGGTNNAGFKALPKNVQANILQNMQGGGTPGQQIPGMPTKAQLDALTGADQIQFVPRTPQYEYLASLPEQSVDFQLPNFVKGSSYNEMLVTRLFKDSELMKLPSQSENFQLDNFKKMEMGGNPFNPLKLFTDDLEKYQDAGSTRKRTREDAYKELYDLQNQLSAENKRLNTYQTNIGTMYDGYTTAKKNYNDDVDPSVTKAYIDKILKGTDINPRLFDVSEDGYVGLDTIPGGTLNWGTKLFNKGEGWGCTSFGCGIQRNAGATTKDGKQFPIISGNSQLNGKIENNIGGLQMQLLDAGIDPKDLIAGDRVVSSYSTSGSAGNAHTLIFSGQFDEDGEPIMMENRSGNWQTGVSTRPLSGYTDRPSSEALNDVNSGLRVTRYIGSTGDLNDQISKLQAEIDAGRFYQDPASIIQLDPIGIEPLDLKLDGFNLMDEMRRATGGEQGEAAYLANRDRVIKREMAKAKKGGETINVDPRMLAKLIAAGADIEML